MRQRKRKFWKGAILALAVAGLATPVAQARPLSKSGTVIPKTTQAGSYSPQALKALALRSEAMNQRYVQLRTEAQTVQAGIPPQALRALTLRSEGLNAQYQQTVVRPDDRAGFRGPGAVAGSGPQAATVGGNGFDWNVAGLGAGLSVAAAILLGGLVIARRKQPHVAV